MLASTLTVIVKMTPAGLEPAIPGSVGRCLIHWATGPVAQVLRGQELASEMGLGRGWQRRPSAARKETS